MNPLVDVDLRPTRPGRRTAGAVASTVSVLRWPSDRSSGVFEMFSAQEAGFFGALERGSSDPTPGENVLLVSATRKADPAAPAVLLSLVNTSPGQAVKLALKLAGPTPRSVAGTILTAPPLGPRAEVSRPESKGVRPAPFHGAVLKGKVVDVTVPARSVVVLTLQQHDLAAVGPGGSRDVGEAAGARTAATHGQRTDAAGSGLGPASGSRRSGRPAAAARRHRPRARR